MSEKTYEEKINAKLDLASDMLASAKAETEDGWHEQAIASLLIAQISMQSVMQSQIERLIGMIETIEATTSRFDQMARRDGWPN